MVPRIGTEFAGYRIVGLVGRGGMSVVYRAENPRLGMTVALKVLAPELAEDEAFRERFVSESRLAAALNHPNIITIYDAGEADGSLYLAMRFVRTDLRVALSGEGPLEPERAVAVLGQVAGALDAAHAEGLIHRDVKPANILLDGGGERSEVAYLADFGLTKHAGSRSGLTATGAFLGTIDYMAPEQIEDRPLDGRTDQYSLGCVAYQCLTGLPPFPRATDAAVLWAHMQDDPPRMSQARAELPAALDAVVIRALAKSPDERYRSCGDLALALADALDERRTLQRTRPAPSSAREEGEDQITAAPTSRRRRRALLALASVLLAGAGAAAGAAAILLAAEPEASERVVTQVRTETAEPPPEEMTAFEREVLRLVPLPFRGTCVPSDQVAQGFDSTVRCRPGAGVLRAEYSHARSGDILQDYFRDRVVTAGVDLGLEDALPKTGSCGSSELAVREWTPRGRTGHEETDSFELALQGYDALQRSRLISGHVLCYRQRGRYWIEWTDQRTAVFGLATGSSAQALVGWWMVSAGPIGPV